MAVPNDFFTVRTKFNEKAQTGQILYCKEHQVRAQTNDDGICPPKRTLLVLNVPPYCDEPCVSSIFRPMGAVENVYLQKKLGSPKANDSTNGMFAEINRTPGFRVAYVVFKASSALKQFKKIKQPVCLTSSSSEKKHDATTVVTGMKKWCQEYRDSRPDQEKLQTEIDEFMAEFDAKKAEREQSAADQEGVPDEEGWVTVTRKGNKPVTARTERNMKRAVARERKKREKKELVNFYRFQLRESKREHIAQLRMKFEKDKEKIALLRAERKFRPY